MSVGKRGHKPCNGEGLTSKVLPFYLSRDHGGDFISYCDLCAHKGVVLRPQVCESRRCNHYYKFYVNGNNFFPERREEETRTRHACRNYGGRNGHHQTTY